MKEQLQTGFIAVIVFAALFSSEELKAQTPIGLTPPDTVGACMDNLYRIIVNTMGLSADTIRISGSLSAVGTSSYSTEGIDFRIDLNNPPSFATTLMEGDSLVFLIPSNKLDTLFYHAYIDCHILPNDTTSGSNIDFDQTFLSNSGVNINGTGNTHFLQY
ncbi:MAG: hypothetical protein IPP71_23430 [Bacteroidetes bacterium]|nr:hypothetical protein [Bacteroidota bacterium]